MVSEPTVLVLGAGASIPYGYPSGVGLVNLILNRAMELRRRRSGGHDDDYFGYPIPVVEEFAERVKASGLYSVDSFLEKPNNVSYLELGKLLIAEQLLPHEDSIAPQVAIEHREDHWYQYLTHRLSENLSAGKQSPLTIVTFNYDRSLDYYLRHSLMNAFGYDDAKANDAFDNLKIIHVHGLLSKLPWGTLNKGEHSRAYGLQGPEAIRDAASYIRIIHEGDVSTPSFVEARKHLEKAKRVCFLGFGYHHANMVRLAHGNWALAKKKGAIVGSSYNLEESEWEVGKNFFGQHFDSAGAGRKCLRALRFYSWILE